MQPSMGTLNSPSSRSSKIWRHLNVESKIWRYLDVNLDSPNLFLNMMNLYLVKFKAQWILNEWEFSSFIISFIYKWILT